MDIYNLPNILVIQLKRFNKEGMSGYGMRTMVSSSKNSEVIDFPINDLDMSKFVLNKNSEQDSM